MCMKSTLTTVWYIINIVQILANIYNIEKKFHKSTREEFSPQNVPVSQLLLSYHFVTFMSIWKMC